MQEFKVIEDAGPPPPPSRGEGSFIEALVAMKPGQALSRQLEGRTPGRCANYTQKTCSYLYRKGAVPKGSLLVRPRLDLDPAEVWVYRIDTEA
jgi:hypothetical protein